MHGDTLQTALRVPPRPEGRLLFVQPKPPAENERSPPVGHRNVSEAATPAACDKKRRHVETAGIGVLLSELT
jgi:hypothetical protein